MQTFRDTLVGPEDRHLPERFFDRFMFNLHRTDSTDLCVVLGAGLYPPVDTCDGFLVVVTGDRQRNLRFATPLSSGSRDGVGPLAWRLLEPMRVWRLVVGPNPTGLELDVVWRARTRAWSGTVEVTNTAAAASSFEHLFQSGRYDGTLSLDGVQEQVAGWYGQRDRSRGVRTMSGGQGLHVWYQAQFPDLAVGFLYVEGRHHDRLLLEGAVMHEDGGLDPIVDVRHDLRFDGGLDLEGGTVQVRTASGAAYRMAADASRGGGFMAGAGYGGQHGHQVEEGREEYDEYPLDGTVSPRSLGSALTDRLCLFDLGGTAGTGILEFAHSRSRSYTYRPTL